MMMWIFILFLSSVFAFAGAPESISEASASSAASPIVPPPAAKSNLFAKAQNLVQASDIEAAIKLLQGDANKNNVKPDEKKLADFNVGYLYFKLGKYEDAIKLFTHFLTEKSDLEEYAHYYLGVSYMQLQQPMPAQKEFEIVLSGTPNVKLRIESASLLGQIALQAKNFKQAKNHLFKLEKRTRGTGQYSEIIYNMALVERGLHNHKASCKWIVKLYSKYPTYTKIADWGANLGSDEIESKPTDCRANPEDFKTRIRNLMWSGLDQKAQGEINMVKEQLVKSDKYSADQLQAQFYMQEGEVVKAMELMRPYYDSMKRNFSYLMFFGSASARAGEVQQAVGSYYSAYKLSPRSKLGRQALYQSAFLSYQFQDYDGASRRFNEFMKVYPTSGLNRDAKWHMAWLKYLKGDYEGAYQDFAKQQFEKRRSRRVKSVTSDRVTYWMAMSRYRQGQYEKAQPLFENLAKDNLIGYYSIVAQFRLKKMTTLKAESNKLAQKSNFIAPRAVSRFTTSEFLMPSVEEDVSTGSFEESNESEETLVANQYEESSGPEAAENAESEEGEAPENADAKTVEVAGDVDRPSPFASANLSKRFEQARDLMTVGLSEWARWDLFDIESKTSNREYLRALMNEYANVGYFHRASYIAQIQFGSQRASQGLELGRSLWEHAYPRAYADSVEKSSKAFQVPTELVWGIMRAESQYRRDAISPVGALGLMQVMPFTGHKVAGLLGDKNFIAPQLLEPEVAIRIGSRYLKRLMDTFENTIPLVAAGYNAGPHRVKTWLASFGTLETDEFIEHIPFLETRNYVKRVISNAQVYAQLYGNKKELFPYLSEVVPAKFSQESVSKENWDGI